MCSKLHTPREIRLHGDLAFLEPLKKTKTSTGFAANAGGARCLGSIFDIALTNSQIYYPFQAS